MKKTKEKVEAGHKLNCPPEKETCWNGECVWWRGEVSCDDETLTIVPQCSKKEEGKK